MIYSDEDLLITSPLIDTERSLAVLLGLHCRALCTSTAIQAEVLTHHYQLTMCSSYVLWLLH